MRCDVPRELWTRDDDVGHGSVQVCREVVDCRLAIIFFSNVYRLGSCLINFD